MKLQQLAPLVVIAAVVMIFAFFMLQTPQVPADYDAFAKCLTEKGAKMYGSELCPHCDDQKEAFGDSWQYVTYVECRSPLGGQTEACMDAGIKAYPTWEFADSSRKTGFLQFKQLSDAIGCPLNSNQ
ncbi:hypothetical protein H0O00_02155 [Candidatus Micrarchaeota archaeon]|nr:hypothetical protein [Candidatus Micrarchaeota archaeon]